MEKQLSNLPILTPQLDRLTSIRKKNDFSLPNVDKYFDSLINQKSSEKAASEKEVPMKESNRAEAEKAEAAEKTEAAENEKPETEGNEEETCDIAREIACAQIVWMTPQIAPEETVVQEQVGELTAVGELLNASVETGEEAVVPGEILPEDSGEAAVEDVAVPQTEILPEQTAETSETVVTEEVRSEVPAETVETEKPETVESDETGGEAVVAEAPLFKDVEAAPIKVAEAPARAEEPQLENQVKDNLVRILESGENRVEIQLQPEALGKLTIELTQNVNGTLNIMLNAENAQTRGVLEKTIGTLQEALADRGQQNVQIQVNRNEESQRQEAQQQDMQDGRNGERNEQQQRRRESSGEDFLQQLRLGLIDLQEEY